MSGVDFMEKLLYGVEVEWKSLGEICEVFTGGEAPVNLIKGSIPTNEYKYPIYGNGAEIYGFTDTYRIDKDAVTISSIGANTGTIYYRKAFFTPIIRLKVLMPKYEWVSSKYIYHYLSSQTISSKKSSVPNMNAADVKKIQIPIPCPDNPKKSLEIQAKIVRILDTFTELTAELTAELSMRKKQYNYYRDKLLTFGEGDVEWKALGEVCEVGDGNHSSKYPRSDEMVEEGIPFIRGTNMVNGTISGKEMKFITPEKHNALKKGHLKAYDVLITNRGEIGKIAQVPKHFCGSNLNSQLAWLRANPDVILPRYLFYVLNATHVQSSISGEGGALQQLTIKNIKLIRIPVPQIKEQNRIVTILDKIYTLTNSITEGLPREIELRQQQYEYYRDLLLSFPKSVESDAVSA